MKENLNLEEILKDCPAIQGYVVIGNIDRNFIIG